MGKLKKRDQQLLEVTTTCINCGAHLELDQRFCSNCGGKRMYNRITWRNLLEDFADRFLNIENAFFKTFINLFKNPEDVIGGYVLGMRKKYLPAFSYFAIAITVAGVSSFIIKNWFLEDMIAAQTSFYQGNDATTQLQKEMTTSWVKGLMDYQSVFYFTAIPFMALFSRLVFWNYKKFNLVEHFVIYLYSYSHIAMITTIVGLCLMWSRTLYQIFSILSIFLMLGYMAYVLKRLFQLNSASIILKTFFFVVLLFSIVVFLSVGIGILFAIQAERGKLDSNSQFTKMINDQVKNIKKAKEEKARKDSLEIQLKLPTSDSIPSIN